MAMSDNDESIVIHFRDINGKRFCETFKNTDAFLAANWEWYDDENYEIFMVEWRGFCVYSALWQYSIFLEDLIGFFS